MAKITIVGAGNSGCAHAAILSSYGHEVTILKTSKSMHDDNFEEIIQQQGINYIDNTVCDKTIRFQKLHKITREVAQAFDETEIVFVLTQSLQHPYIANYISPFIQNIRALVIVPGNLGSVFFRNRLPKNILVAEGESTILDARIEKPGLVRILFKNVRNALSFNPAANNIEGLNYISANIPNYTHLRTNIVETAMHNPNLIVHTIGTIMSASRIEYSNGDFWMYKEGFTPSIWNLIERLDKEKNDVIEAYGGKPVSYLECCKFRNEHSLDVDAREVFDNYAMNGSPKGPFSINNRYITEDVPNGLCTLSSLAKKAGINTPTADALITISSILLQKDFYSIGRTVSALGWNNISIEEIKDLIG